MNAFQIPVLRWSLPSGGDIVWRRFVSVNNLGQAIQATAATQVVGAAQNDTKAGQVQEILNGLVMVEAAGAITAGALVYSNATGLAAGTGTVAVGIAITGATAAGQLVTVLTK